MSDTQLIEALADYYRRNEQFCEKHDLYTEDCYGCESALLSAKQRFMEAQKDNEVMAKIIDLLNEPKILGGQISDNLELEMKCRSILARLEEVEDSRILIDILLFHTICPAGLCMTEASFIIENLTHHLTSGQD